MLGLSTIYFVVLCCYALFLWYGGYLVRHHYTNRGLAIATMFYVMIGGPLVLFLPLFHVLANFSS